MLEKYRNGPFITYTLFAIQVVVFLLEYLLPVKQLGSMYGPLVAYLHEYWRFVTPIFIHYGLMHIVFNSVVLYYMGQQLEAIYGHWRFLAIYLLSGILGNMTSFAFNQVNVSSAGASTALFGVFGAFVAMGMHFKHYPGFKELTQQYLILIGINLAFGLVGNGIDIFGHIGGVLGGFVLGQTIAVPCQKDSYRKSIQVLFGLIFVFLCIFCLLYGFKKYQLLV
ncbi:rhomboid family intramembrane serine protease [Enterococcus cecorum]|nr:rhomboid family intramembrane serine protease [Enterococcus cecorum]